MKNMKKTNKSLFKRLLCLTLCLAVFLPVVYIPAFSADAKAATGSSAAGTVPHESVESYSVGGVNYDIKRSTKYLGNRTYEIQMKLTSSISLKDYAVNRDFSKNGYFTVQKDGWYLLELWGGDGAAGQDCIQLSFALTPYQSPGGAGALGGYVYAKVYMLAGQTLVYSIGTNGTQSESYDDAGGGANGDGGTHGTQGNYMVGGGGGYSAFYLLQEGDNFDPAWVTETSVDLPEALRLSRYIMIAGGGGGGGAGCGSIVINNTSGDLLPPNGGAGGRSTSAPVVLGEDYDVPGYVYAGWNGSSSGTSTDYVGIGGSVTPGACSNTWLGVTDSAKMPNDWSGLANPDAEPGAGGAGNYRGGGGGAGFAGGSGGIMASFINASHVGGGGGGSSFIAAKVNGKDLVLDLTGDVGAQFRLGLNNKPSTAANGGAAHMIYLGDDENEIDTDALEDNVSLSVQISKYFDVISAVSIVTDPVYSSKNQQARLNDGTGLVTVSAADSNGYVMVTASALGIRPESVFAGQTGTVTIRVRAKTEFMGGNDVEMVRSVDRGVVMSFYRPDDGVKDELTSKPANNYTHNYVNVPLSAKMVTHSYTSSSKGKSYQVSSLYEDSYASVRGTVNTTSATYEYAFIKSIGTYSVKDSDGDLIETASVAPTETEKYTVSYLVTVKAAATAACTVGPAIPVETSVTGMAVISIVEPDNATLNGLDVYSYKTLNFEDGVYRLGVGVNQQSATIQNPLATTVSFKTADNKQYTWSPSQEGWGAGWYYIQAWGGNGGSSGSITATGKRGNDERKVSSVNGGTGGYVDGYIYLTADSVIEYSVGAAGYTGTTYAKGAVDGTNDRDSNSDRGSFYGDAGGGGSATFVSCDDVALLIAGGGGGAGQSALRLTQSTITWGVVYGDSDTSPGASSTTVTTDSSPNADTSVYNGSNGQNNATTSGQNFSPSATAGTRGTAGSSFLYSDLVDGYDPSGSSFTMSESARLNTVENISQSKSNGKNGQVTITLIESEQGAEQVSNLYGLSVNGTVSRYFDVEGVEMAQASVAASTSSVTENGDGSKTVTYYDAQGEEISHFTYKLTEGTLSDGSPVTEWTVSDTYYIPQAVEASSTTMYYQSSLTFTLKLTPKEGFLGGNDVPLVAYDETNTALNDTTLDQNPYYGVCVAQREQTMNLQPKDPTDFANVAVEYDLLGIFEAWDTTIRLGESVDNTSLYTFTPPTYVGEDAWKAEFVEFVAPTFRTYTPDKTTVYDLTAKLQPKTGAEKATIVGEIAALETTLSATVYVELPITYELTNMTPTGTSWVLYGTPINERLYADAGYELPTSVEVTYTADGSGVEHTFESGLLSVQGTAVTQPITVTASAAVKTYDVYLQYVTEKDYDESTPMTTEKIEGLAAGASLAEVWARVDAITAENENKYEGYRFSFQSDADDPATPEVERRETMPAHDLYIIGTFEKLLYPVVIHYLYENGEKAAEDHVGYVYYGDTFTVTSPAVNGYRADRLTVSGTQGAELIEETVTYHPSENELIILYVKQDGTPIYDPYVTTVADGASYSVASPTVKGYTPDLATVSGTMSADGESVTVTVVYTPKTYPLQFVYAYAAYPEAGALKDTDFSNATMNGAGDRLVEFDRPYTYNPATKAYEGLPTPLLAGYVFDGWYADEALTQKVDEQTLIGDGEDDLVMGGGTITLYAKWKPESYRLVVDFVLVYTAGDYLPDGTEAALKAAYHSQMHEFGSSVTVTLPKIEGYTPYLKYLTADQEALSGDTWTLTMPGQNRKIEITYLINEYEITFADAASTGVRNPYVTYSDADTATEFDNFSSKTWETVSVKHNVEPVYSNSTPTHATTERYTYTFVKWSGEDEEKKLPQAAASVTYYACYTATENIVGVTYGSTTAYFTNVADAIARAETYISNSPTIKFRRNTSKEIDLDEYGTLIFGKTYTGTENRTISIDLNGLMLSTSGATAVECTQNAYISLIFTKGTANEGTIRVSGDGDVTAIDFKARKLDFSSAITVEAISQNGNATAINYDVTYSGYYLYLTQNNLKVSAQAQNGTAVAIALPQTTAYTPTVSGSSAYQNVTLSASGKNAYGIYASGSYTLSNWYGTVNATASGGTDSVACGIYGASSSTITNSSMINVTSEGKGYGVILTGSSQTLNMVTVTVTANEAVGVRVQDGATLSIGSADFVLNVNGTQSAVGIEVESGATLSNSTATSVNVQSNGNSYGVLNRGTVSSIALTLTVTSVDQNAYGLYNDGGSVTGSGVTANFNVTASSENGIGYGVYSNGGSVGSEDSYISKGTVAGSHYGVYCEDGSIYVSGFDLYLKGTDGDEAAALVGATVYTGHYVTEAVDAAHAGYYRLGAYFTVTFVTNGGSEIAEITQLNGTAVTAPDDPTKRGYTFEGWYADEALTTAKTVPATMPNSDLFLYADWEIVVYKYVLDAGVPSDTPTGETITVVFHKNYPVTNPNDTAAQNISITYNGDASVFADVRDLTYVPKEGNNPVCIQRGWYNSDTITSANYVLLDDSEAIYALDTDHDKVVHLYAGWKQLYSSKNKAAFDSNSDNVITISGDRGYIYYAVPSAGNYEITLQMKSGTGYLGGMIYRYSGSSDIYKKGTSTAISYSASSGKNDVSNTTTQVYTASDCQPGDIISFIWLSGNTGTFSLYVSSLPDGAPMGGGSGGAPVTVYTYTVEDGVVTLPVSVANDDPTMRFAGWAIDNDDNLQGTRSIQLTPEMTETLTAWQNGEVLYLSSLWEVLAWSSYISGTRNFTAFETAEEVTVKDNATLSVRFVRSSPSDDEMCFKFKNGLPKDTLLTLIDRSGDLPVYYGYTVTDALVTEIPANAFVSMDGTETPFVGYSVDMVLQICYANANVQITDETVGIYDADDVVSQTERLYALTDTAPAVTEKDPVSFDYETLHQTSVSVPVLTEKGFSEDDRVYLLIRWDGLSMACGVVCSADGTEMLLYGDRYAALELGTVADFAASRELNLSIDLGTMMQNEFAEQGFVYEIRVAPAAWSDAKILCGIEIQTVARTEETVTLLETPSLGIESLETLYLSKGETLTVSGITVQSNDPSDTDITVSDVSVYLWQSDRSAGTTEENGGEVLMFTENCTSLFDPSSGLLVSANGVYTDTGESVIDGNGNFEAVIGQDAASGTYYLVFVLGDKTMTLTVKIL